MTDQLKQKFRAKQDLTTSGKQAGFAADC